MEIMKEMIMRHEGLRLTPYRCSAGKLTIGYGRNLEEVGISQEEAEYLLTDDIKRAWKEVLRIFPHYYSFSQNRQTALIDMMYNLGATKFRTFKKMIAAIKVDDWEEASRQAEDSKWYHQVGQRGVEIKNMLRKG